MGPAIAHLFLSFGFGDDHLAISIEARKDRTREYATLPGFFRQYELVYSGGGRARRDPRADELPHVAARGRLPLRAGGVAPELAARVP
jgi:hypothetical protein